MSTVTSKDLAKAKKWCDEARALLKAKKLVGKGATAESKALKDATKLAMAGLEILKKNPQGSSMYSELAKEFVGLAKLGETAGANEDQALALVLTAQLEHLQNRMDYACGKINREQLDQSRTTLDSKVEQQYQRALQTAKQMQLDLSTMAEGLHKFDGQVTRTIEQAVAAAEETTSKGTREVAYTEAVEILATVKSQFEAANKQHEQFVAYKSARLDAVEYSNQLRLLNPDYATPVDTIVQQVDTSLSLVRDYAAAIKRLADAKTAYDKVIKDNKVSKDQVSYIQAMAEAKSRALELAARSRDGMDFAEALNKNIKVALGIANSSQPDFKTAVKALGDTKALYEQNKKLADQQDEKLTQAARHKPVYDDKVLRIKAAIAELEKLPGTAVAVGQLNGLLQAGENALRSSQDYHLAYQALQGLTAARQSGLQAAASFNQTVGDELYRSNLQAAEAALAELEKLVGGSQFSLVAEKRQAIDKSLMVMSQGGKVQEQTLILGTLAGQTKQLLRDLTELRKQCVEQKQKLDLELQEFQKKCLIGEFDVLPMLRIADADFGVCDYEAALRQYQAVEQRLLDIESKESLNDAYTQWAETLKTLNEKVLLDNSLSHLEMLGKSRTVACKPLFQLGAPLESEMSAVLKSLSQTRRYKEALETANRVLQTTPVMAEMLKKYQAGTELRKTLQTEGNQLAQDAYQKIAELEKLGGHVAEFKSLVETASAAWTQKLNVGEFVDEAKWQEAFAAYQKQLTDNVITAVAAILKNDSGQLKASVDQATQAKAQAGLDKQLQVIAAQIREMSADAGAFEFLGPLIATSSLPEPLIESAQSQLESLRSTAPDKIDEGVLAATKLESDIKEVVAKLEQEKLKLSTLAKQRAQECATKIKELKKEHKEYEPFFATALASVDDYISMANSTVCSTVERAVFALNKFSSEQVEPLAAAFTTLVKQFETIQLDLDDADFKKLMPDRRKTFNFRFTKDIKIEAINKGPLGAKEAVESFALELRTAVQDARKALQMRQDIDRIAKECTAKVGQLRNAPHLQKSFEAMIDTAATPRENAESSSLQQLKALNNQLTSLVSEAGLKILPEMEKATHAKELKSQLKLEEFKAARDVLDKNQIRDAENKLKEIDSSKTNWDLYKQIKENRKQADEMFAKGLLEAAIDKLDAARAVAIRFTDNPFNQQTTSRNQLDKVLARWTKTVGEFVKSMGGLQLAVQQSMEEENALRPNHFDIPAVLKPLLEVSKTFEATKFDQYVKTITDELSRQKIENFKAYRQAKEEALRFVRHYQTVAAKDPVLNQVATNPFGVVVPVRAIQEALRDLELNLRRA